jgi:hypothetical protein
MCSRRPQDRVPVHDGELGRGWCRPAGGGERFCCSREAAGLPPGHYDPGAPPSLGAVKRRFEVSTLKGGWHLSERAAEAWTSRENPAVRALPSAPPPVLTDWHTRALLRPRSL